MITKMLFSRSHIEARWRCPRYQYLQFYHAGTGIVSRRVNTALSAGGLAHEMLAAIMRYMQVNHDLPNSVRDNIIENILREDAAVEREFEPGEEWDLQRLLVGALVRGWCRLRLPYIASHYRILEVEREVTLDFSKTFPNLKWMSRIDAELERIEDGELFALEFKTTGVNRDSYFESWRYDAQTMAHTWVMEQLYDRPCGGVMMEWLYKGYKRDGVIYSPLIRGSVYTDPITGDRQTQYETVRRKGWESAYVTQPELPEWIAGMPEETLRQQYFWREIYRNPDEIDIWKAQTFCKMQGTRAGLLRLGDCKDLAHPELTVSFPARMSSECYNDKYGHKCTYLPICYRQIDNPLGSGEYVRREPHHKQEWVVVEA